MRGRRAGGHGRVRAAVDAELQRGLRVVDRRRDGEAARGRVGDAEAVRGDAVAKSRRQRAGARREAREARVGADRREHQVAAVSCDPERIRGEQVIVVRDPGREAGEDGAHRLRSGAVVRAQRDGGIEPVAVVEAALEFRGRHDAVGIDRTAERRAGRRDVRRQIRGDGRGRRIDVLQRDVGALPERIAGLIGEHGDRCRSRSRSGGRSRSCRGRWRCNSAAGCCSRCR